MSRKKNRQLCSLLKDFNLYIPCLLLPLFLMITNPLFVLTLFLLKHNKSSIYTTAIIIFNSQVIIPVKQAAQHLLTSQQLLARQQICFSVQSLSSQDIEFLVSSYTHLWNFTILNQFKITIQTDRLLTQHAQHTNKNNLNTLSSSLGNQGVRQSLQIKQFSGKPATSPPVHSQTTSTV